MAQYNCAPKLALDIHYIHEKYVKMRLPIGVRGPRVMANEDENCLQVRRSPAACICTPWTLLSLLAQ
jgi:hypothetical protein